MLSELLQNADDAGATEATVEIDGGEFIFSHNGEDFQRRAIRLPLQVRILQQADAAHYWVQGSGLQEHLQLGQHSSAGDANAFGGFSPEKVHRANMDGIPPGRSMVVPKFALIFKTNWCSKSWARI